MIDALPAQQVVKLRGGHYDFSRKAELKQELDAVQPRKLVVLDLAETTCLECAEIGVIVGKLREWRQFVPDAQLHLRNVSGHIARMLRLLELDSEFIVESEQPQG
jgi:anti-anti-sigma regulatory factor